MFSPPPTASTSQDGHGLTAEYFSQNAGDPARLTRDDPTINFRWNTRSPLGTRSKTLFSARWLGFLQPLYSETYTFTFTTTGRATLWIDGQEVIAEGQTTGNIKLQAQHAHAIEVRYDQLTPVNDLRLEWQSSHQSRQVIPAAQLLANRSSTLPSATTRIGKLDLPLNQNLLVNADFESAGGWSTGWGAMQTSQPGRNGTGRAASVPKYNSLSTSLSPSVLEQGATYVVDVWGKAPIGGSCTARIEVSDGPAIKQTVLTFNTDTWQKLSFTAEHPYSAERLYIRLGSDATNKGACAYDDISAVAQAVTATPPVPARNLLTDGGFEQGGTGWSLTTGGTLPLSTPGRSGTGSALDLTPTANDPYGLAAEYTLPAAQLKPSTDYVFTFWGAGDCAATIIDPSQATGYFAPGWYNFSGTSWRQKRLTLTTPASAADFVLNLSSLGNGSCRFDDVAFGPLVDDQMVSVTPLGAPPAPIPAPYSIVKTYLVTAPQAAFAQANMEVVIPISNPENPDYIITELYKYENGTYVKEQIGGEESKFRLFINPEMNSDGTLPNSFEGTYVIVKASISDLKASFAATGGFFNGIYGECPEGMVSSFGNCISAPMVLNGQAINLLNPGKNFISLNAGNASAYCTQPGTSYNAKLCSFAAEERIRNEIVNTRKPDIVTIQELWNGDCSFIIPDIVLDRVCGPRFGTLRLTGGETAQVKRLFPTSIYDTTCAPLEAGGYECTAIRKTVFKFDTPSYEVASGVKNEITATPDYCADDLKQNGRDTGFFGTTISLVNPIGPRPVSFDLWNAHLATPAPIGSTDRNVNCRSQQISTLSKAYASSKRKLLIAGDFNTEFGGASGSYPSDVAALRGMATSFDTKVDAVAAVRLSYMISNQTEKTAYSATVLSINLFGILGPYSYDHVMSNFSDVVPGASCRRIAIAKLDHRSTQCALQGFDIGTVRTGLLVTDTSGQYPTEYVSTLVKAYRKGAKMPWVQWTGSTVHDVYIPDNVETQVEVNMNCLYASPASQIFSVQANEAIGTTLRQGVFRPYCP